MSSKGPQCSVRKEPPVRSMLAVAKRILQQFIHDKRTLGLLFVAPMVVLWLLTVLLGAGDYVPRLATIDLPADYMAELEAQDCTVSEVSADQAEELLRTNQVDAVLSMSEDSQLVIWAEGSDSTKTAACRKVAVEAMSEANRLATDKMKADVEAKKAEITDLRNQAEQKQAEIRSLIDSKRSEALGKASDARAAQAQLKEQLAHRVNELNASLEQMGSALQQLVDTLPEEEQPKFAPLVYKIQSAHIDMRQISLPESNLSIDIDLDVDTNIELPNMDDFSIDPADYLPVQDIQVTYLHGNENWKMFDFYGPVFIGIFLFAFVFITSGMSLVNERTSGTMRRFLATPIKPGQILGGYVLGFGAFAAIQATVVLWFSLNVMRFPNEGNIFLVVLIAVLLALVSVTMGLLVSGLASSGFQVIQLMLVFVVPQILLSGLFDLSVAPGWLQGLSVCLPMHYGVDALRQVMLRGADLQAIGLDIAVLCGFVTLFFALASLRFRKKRA